MKKTVMPRKLYVWIKCGIEGKYPVYFASESMGDIPYDQHKNIVGIYIKENQGTFTVQTKIS